MPVRQTTSGFLSTASLLAILFAALYFAIGPGCFFSVDEVVVQEMAQSVYRRGNLEIPAVETAASGVAGAYYSHRGPALGYIALPFVIAGEILDDWKGSFTGSVATGPPLGTVEHPLRWGGRYSVFTALLTNAVAGGLLIAVLYLLALNFKVTDRTAVAFACSTGVATLIVSESTHFFQHPLEALFLLCGFWFYSSAAVTEPAYAWLGGLSLGLALLARPNSAPAALGIWIYGCIAARMKLAAERRPVWLAFLARSVTGPVICGLLYGWYNFIQFGNPADFGYRPAIRIFQFTLTGPLRAVAAYLFSPVLSIFLFSPMLLLIPIVWRESRSRWPLETKCLLVASLLNFLPITLLPVWDGAIAFGPRYLLAPMMMLLPLALPAFEKAIAKPRSRWPAAVWLATLAGVAVQLIGISVYVATNEWYYNKYDIYANRAFVFTPSASPVWVQLKDLLAGKNIIPWGFRAIAHPGPAFALLVALLSTVMFCGRLLWRTRERQTGSVLPAYIVAGMASVIVLGFLATTGVSEPPQKRNNDQLNVGLAAQGAARDVEAEENYALVLSRDAQNKYALRNLAMLYQKVNQPEQARSLYRRALASETHFCRDSVECYDIGQEYWNTGDMKSALQIWELTAQQFPAETWLLRDIARARYDLGDFDGAIRDYRQASTLAPGDDTIRIDLAWSLLAASKFDEAHAICEEVLARDGTNRAALTILSRIAR